MKHTELDSAVSAFNHIHRANGSNTWLWRRRRWRWQHQKHSRLRIAIMTSANGEVTWCLVIIYLLVGLSAGLHKKLRADLAEILRDS